VRKRLKRLPPAEWSVLIHDHHPGFVDWATFEANQVRLASISTVLRSANTRTGCL
jgi:hypothetical protein